MADATLDALMGAIQASVNSVPSITGASSTFLATFAQQIQAALDYVETQVDAADTALTSLPAISSGIDPNLAANTLIAAATQSAALANYFVLQNTLGRLLKNVQAITG